jgi:putative intracellular protease/amidase
VAGNDVESSFLPRHDPLKMGAYNSPKGVIMSYGRRIRLVALASAFLGVIAVSAAGAQAPVVSPPVAAATQALPIVHVPKRPGAPPVIVVIAQSNTVLSDYVVPYGVLAQSGAAKVIAVNMLAGPLKAGPLTLLPDMTASEFDRRYPEGADYVIVPATADEHSEEIRWLGAQHSQGATLVSICDGVELLAEAGVLDGRRATGHWASLKNRRKHYPNVTWLTDLRYVADRDVASSAGVSAALPISLALVQTISGAEVARATADRLGVASWDAKHDSAVFKVRGDDRAVHRANMRSHSDVVALAVHDGEDEVALSLHAEAWSRTMRDDVRLVSEAGGPVRLRGGLRVETAAAAAITPDVRIALNSSAPAGTALSAAFDRIAQRYGPGSARLAALGMEYPWGDLKASR